MKEKIIVVFSRNKDGKTANMFIDNYLIDEDIPFIPAKATDHRGTALWFYATQNKLAWEDFELDEKTENEEEVKRAFDYMFQPELIDVEIGISNEQRRLQRRKY